MSYQRAYADACKALDVDLIIQRAANLTVLR